MKAIGESPGISKIRRGFCKAEAHKLLRSLWIESPEEINLEALAYKAGSLLIEDGGLENCEGRIVTTGQTGGTIRVKNGLNPGRRRFTIGHEIGHYKLHPTKKASHDDVASNFRIWNDASEESEANLFAAELLMPDFLFKPLIVKQAPSLTFMDKVGGIFSTSMMATCYQFVTYSREPVAMVVSVDGKVKWKIQSENFSPLVTSGQLHEYSGAAEIQRGKYGDTNGMVNVPATAWLPYENTNADLKEDSRHLDWYGCVVTLLWLDDDL